MSVSRPLCELDLRDESRSSDSYYPANGVDQNHWDERNESIEPKKVSPDTSGAEKTSMSPRISKSQAYFIYLVW
jgi:hypothetical protein